MYCAIVPTYNNPTTIAHVVAQVGEHLPVIVVDDGSAPAGAEAVAELAEQNRATVVRLAENGGKGTAIEAGLRRAQALGFTHALALDADGQHACVDIPRFLQLSRAHADAMVLGVPRFDASAPLGRRFGRLISVFWVQVETCSKAIRDPLCGYRVYPIEPALKVAELCGRRMDFDPEILVRMAWEGVPIASLETAVIYPEGGVSHFRMWRDNVGITKMHTRLCMEAIVRVLSGKGIRGRRA
jgi:glycosyltransferase involved in cell wall biosynthesis